MATIFCTQHVDVTDMVHMTDITDMIHMAQLMPVIDNKIELKRKIK